MPTYPKAESSIVLSALHSYSSQLNVKPIRLVPGSPTTKMLSLASVARAKAGHQLLAVAWVNEDIKQSIPAKFQIKQCSIAYCLEVASW